MKRASYARPTSLDPPWNLSFQNSERICKFRRHFRLEPSNVVRKRQLPSTIPRQWLQPRRRDHRPSTRLSLTHDATRFGANFHDATFRQSPQTNRCDYSVQRLTPDEAAAASDLESSNTQSTLAEIRAAAAPLHAVTRASAKSTSDNRGSGHLSAQARFKPGLRSRSRESGVGSRRVFGRSRSRSDGDAKAPM